MKYIRPDIGNNAVPYKGRRFWVIEVASCDKFEAWTRDEYRYVVWDCRYGGSFALLNADKSGRYIGSIIAHVEFEKRKFDTLQEAANSLSREYDWYIKACYG